MLLLLGACSKAESFQGGHLASQLRCPQSTPKCLGLRLALISVPFSCPWACWRQQVTSQVLRSLPPTCIKLQAPGFSLPQLWLLCAFGASTNTWKIFPSLSAFQIKCNKHIIQKQRLFSQQLHLCTITNTSGSFLYSLMGVTRHRINQNPCASRLPHYKQ